MLQEHIKQMFHSQTKPFLPSTSSRKTNTLQKRSQAISTISIQDLPSYSPNKQFFSDQKPTRFQTQQHQITQQTSSQNGNSVSCQTNMPLYYIDKPFPDIPPSDPIWLLIIPHEILQKSSVEQLFNQNKEYLYYLLSLYFQEKIQGDYNKNKQNLPTKWKTNSNHDIKSKIQEKLLLNKNSQNQRSHQNFQFAQTSYKTDYPGYSPPNYKTKQEKFKFEKIQQQFPTFTSTQTYQMGKTFNRKFCPRLSTSTEFSQQTQTNYNKNFMWPQIIEQTQNKNNNSKLNPISSKGVIFEKQTESYFQYPLHPVPKTTKPYHQQQYSAIIKRDILGPRIGDVTQMKNWRQSVLKKKMNQFRSQSQD
ncbi:unnamed protein product [Paramecium sonneborni]|uniref:Uncharacterized protein n=1 Tax=Paramecium sonneborni TaxID=65129 RepID=A0A8S1PYH6_9CILI|nr:unnamed protein product [Paramecium sonneborni]